MSLVTDWITAGGTLAVTVGSGLQAWNELRRYQAVLDRLGITGLFKAYRNLTGVMQRVQWSVFSPWFLLPVQYSIWNLPARTRELKEASKEYMDAMLVVTRAYLGLLEKQTVPEDQRTETDAELEKQKKAQLAELRSLGLKSLYWALIMLGSAAILVAVCMSIYSDYNP